MGLIAPDPERRWKDIAPWLPYAAVLVGLYAFHSAWVALGLYHAGMLAFLLPPGGRPALRSLGQGRIGRAGFLLIATSALAGPAFGLLWPWIGGGFPPLRVALAAYGLSGPAWWLFAIYYGCVHPGIEEAYWRGFIVPRARQPWIADLQFAGYHALVLVRFVRWPGVIATLAVLAGVSWIWRDMARRQGGLVTPWLSHLAGDASFIVAVAVLLHRF